MLLRGPLPEERDALLAVASASGLFAPGEVEALLGAALTQLHAGALPPGHAVRVAADDAQRTVLGWAYAAPAEGEPAARELLWLGVAPAARRAGVAALLLADAERAARDAGAATLLIRTSTAPETAAARALYRKYGYTQHGEDVADFYGPGEDMLEFRKQLSA